MGKSRRQTRLERHDRLSGNDKVVSEQEQRGSVLCVITKSFHTGDGEELLYFAKTQSRFKLRAEGACCTLGNVISDRKQRGGAFFVKSQSHFGLGQSGTIITVLGQS